MHLLLIRHGETVDNVNRTIGSRLPGPPLSDVGIEQARGVGARLPFHPTTICSSRALRAVQTATAIAAEIGAPHVEIDGLQEIDAGDLEGLSYDEGLAGYAGTFQQWWTDPDARIPGGETGSEFMRRFDRAIAAVLADLPEHGTAAVVSHEAAIRVWAGSTSSNLDAAFSRTHGLGNVGVVALSGSPSSGWLATSWDGHPVDH